jgi:hypothetical protein
LLFTVDHLLHDGLHFYVALTYTICAGRARGISDGSAGCQGGKCRSGFKRLTPIHWRSITSRADYFSFRNVD